MVLLKLQQYSQHSVARPLSAKLARRYYGPFKVIERIGHRLQLPAGARIHDVFHVGLLRKFIEGQAGPSPAELPSEFIANRPISTPTQIVGSRVVLHAGQPVDQVLVRWSGDDQPTPTWEPLQEISRRFPYLLLEDKSGSNGGGVDTSVSLPTLDHQPNATDLQDEAQQSDIEPTRNEPAKKNQRPRRVTRPPDRFQDYVRRSK